MARFAKLLATFVAGAVLTVGCGSAPPGPSILDGDTGSSDSSGGDGGSDQGSAGTNGTGAGTGTGTNGTGAGTGTGTAGTGAGSSGTSMVQEATFVVTLAEPALDINLMDALEVDVSVAPNGYKGDVALAVTDPGGMVTAELVDKSVTLDGQTTVITKLKLSTASATPPGDVKFVVSAAVANGTKTADGSATVHSDITITIPAGVNGMSGTGSFGDYPIKITAPANISDQNPVIVRFYNADTKNHQIHAGNNGQGFPHDPGPIAPNSMDGLVRSVNSGGTFDFYLHDQGSPINQGRIQIQ